MLRVLVHSCSLPLLIHFPLTIICSVDSSSSIGAKLTFLQSLLNQLWSNPCNKSFTMYIVTLHYLWNLYLWIHLLTKMYLSPPNQYSWCFVVICRHAPVKKDEKFELLNRHISKERRPCFALLFHFSYCKWASFRRLFLPCFSHFCAFAGDCTVWHGPQV